VMLPEDNPDILLPHPPLMYCNYNTRLQTPPTPRSSQRSYTVSSSESYPFLLLQMKTVFMRHSTSALSFSQMGSASFWTARLSKCSELLCNGIPLLSKLFLLLLILLVRLFATTIKCQYLTSFLTPETWILLIPLRLQIDSLLVDL
jgi:hypothetical protein